MGCDIHPHIEVKINGKREHYSVPRLERNYSLFSRAAGVRKRDDIEPIAQPRGLPNDMSLVTKLEAEDWGTDGHSHSWLNADELADLIRFHEEQLPKGEGWRAEHEQWGYLGGNRFGSFNKYRDHYPAWVQDLRLVFWFDN